TPAGRGPGDRGQTPCRARGTGTGGDGRAAVRVAGTPVAYPAPVVAGRVRATRPGDQHAGVLHPPRGRPAGRSGLAAPAAVPGVRAGAVGGRTRVGEAGPAPVVVPGGPGGARLRQRGSGQRFGPRDADRGPG